jgi:HAD superfamily hydrolase (TIGR01509 family)
MTTPFSDRGEFVRFVCGELACESSPEIEERCAAIVRREIDSVVPVDGAVSLLAFLKRRGFALGLLSNSSSIHKEPLVRLGLDKYFDATIFSCDAGVCKPEPRLYLDLCSHLGVEAEATLFVGDSPHHDVLAPRALGLKALQVSDVSTRETVARLGDLGWMHLDREPKKLLAERTKIEVGAVSHSLLGLEPAPDSEQGRFNLVARARLKTVADSTGGPGESKVFFKRCLLPEAVHVEEFMHRLLKKAGMPSCSAAVAGDEEPVLVASVAPGVKFQGPVDPPLAYEIGRHCAAAYLFANADLRPRNAFVSYDGPRPLMTMVDLEHCLFNLALDTTGLEDPLRPQTFDRMDEDEVATRLRRRVLTPRTTRRAMATFLKLDSFESDTAIALKEGWVKAYEDIQGVGDQLCDTIEHRVYTEPFLIIGTQAYRRAMAKLDVEDVRSRMREDPVALFSALTDVRRKAS